MAADDHAVVVGINCYPAMGSLQGPCNDARLMQEWLLSPQGGNVPTEHLKVLVNTDYTPECPDEIVAVHPVEDEVNALFSPMVQESIGGRRLGRRLYIYMAGHGFSDPLHMNATALYAANAQAMFAPHIAGTYYAEWFRKNAVFDEIVLMMDCCRLVNPMHSIRQPPLPNISNTERAKKVRVFYAYGTVWGAVSREKNIDGEMKGIFTEALLQALKNARPNRYGRVTGQVVLKHVHNLINRVAGDTSVEPPDIQVDINRDIVFLERETIPQLKITFILQNHMVDEILVIYDGVQKEIERLISNGPRVTLELASGLYKVVRESSGRQLLFEMVENNVEISL